MSKASKAFLQLGLALVFSLVAGVLIFKWMSARGRVEPVAKREIQTVRALVASRDLARGTKLGPGMYKNATFMPGTLPAGVFSSTIRLQGQVLFAPMTANEVFTESKLVSRNNTMGGVSAMVSPGKRAMAVKGNMVLGLSGFIRPGNKVDVLVTLDAGEKRDKPMTKLVLSNIVVLATGTELEPSPDGKGTSPVDTYTLELSPEEGETLALASTKGTLHFALRNAADNATVLTRGVDVKAALASFRAEGQSVAEEKAPVSGAPKRVVQLITGGAVSEVAFQAGSIFQA